MQALIAVLLGDGKPVAQTLGVGLENISNERIDLPAVLFLAVGRRVKNNTYGKQVVYPIHIAVLRLHLVINRVDGFGSSFDSEDKARVFEFLLQRGDKAGDIGITLRLFGIERMRNIFICLVVGKL